MKLYISKLLFIFLLSCNIQRILASGGHNSRDHSGSSSSEQGENNLKLVEIDLKNKNNTTEFSYSSSDNKGTYTSKFGHGFKSVKFNQVQVWQSDDPAVYATKVERDGVNWFSSSNNVTITLSDSTVKKFEKSGGKWVEQSQSGTSGTGQSHSSSTKSNLTASASQSQHHSGSTGGPTGSGQHSVSTGVSESGGTGTDQLHHSSGGSQQEEDPTSGSGVTDPAESSEDVTGSKEDEADQDVSDPTDATDVTGTSVTTPDPSESTDPTHVTSEPDPSSTGKTGDVTQTSATDESESVSTPPKEDDTKLQSEPSESDSCTKSGGKEDDSGKASESNSSGKSAGEEQDESKESTPNPGSQSQSRGSSSRNLTDTSGSGSSVSASPTSGSATSQSHASPAVSTPFKPKVNYTKGNVKIFAKSSSGKSEEMNSNGYDLDETDDYLFKYTFKDNHECSEFQLKGHSMWEYGLNSVKKHPKLLYFSKLTTVVFLDFGSNDFYLCRYSVDESKFKLEKLTSCTGVQNRIKVLTKDGGSTKENDTSKYESKDYGFAVEIKFKDDAECVELKVDDKSVWKYESTGKNKTNPYLVYFMQKNLLAFFKNNKSFYIDTDRV